MDDYLIFKNTSSAISIKPLYFIGGYVTYEIGVSTHGFSGAYNFTIMEKKLKEYVETIECMSDTLNGEIEICDCESDAYMKFFFEDKLNFYVSGQIGGSHQENILNFKLKANQTVLIGLKEKLLAY